MNSFTRFDARLCTVYDTEASHILGRDYWRVTQGFRYYIGSKDSGRYVDVPTGFLTDGASIPRVFWSILPPWGEYGQAAALHDYLCERMECIVLDSSGKPTWEKLTRKEVDEILYEAMDVLNVTPWKRTVIKSGVDLYRLTRNPTRPTIDRNKRALEARYVA